MVTGMILAAGESRRMQSPKALLQIGTETFLECIIRKCKEAGIYVVYVVVGAHRDEIQRKIQPTPDVHFIYNFRYLEGQLSSLKEGLRNLPTGATAALVWPVDQPLVKKETITLLLEQHKRGKKQITIPTFNSKHGHPVIYDVRAIYAALSLKASQTAKELRSIFANDLLLVDVTDPGVLTDIDTPEDYKQFVSGAS